MINEIENHLRNLLAHNIVAFTYRKVNGEIRNALGTRNLDLARQHTGENIPNPTGCEQPTSYYDVRSMGWRSWKEGNVISIDGFVPVNVKVESKEIPVHFHGKAKTLGEPIEMGELPIGNGKSVPVKMQPVDLGGLGGLLGGFGGGIPKDEIRKAMGDLDKDIEFVPLGGKGGYGKVGVPTATEKGIALPLGEIGVEDFAKMVAHYVVEELVSRLAR